MMIKVYFIYKKQFIGEIQVDESIISIWSDQFTDYDEYNKKTINPPFNGQYEFNDNVIIQNDCKDISDNYFPNITRIKPKYYDVNLNKVNIETINEIKLNSKEYYEVGAFGQPILYKSLDVVQQLVLHLIYNCFCNGNKYINLSELYVEPEKNSGTINLYNSYGDIITTYFHLNGKISGECISYLSNYYELEGINCEAKYEKLFYIDGVKQGKAIKLTKENILIEECYYINDILEGEMIKYDKDGNKKEIKMYINGLMIDHKILYPNGKIKIHNKFNGAILIFHKSYYENGNVHFRVGLHKNNTYKLQYYFENGKNAWKCINIIYKGLNNIVMINDEEGNKITEDKFNKLYITCLKPCDINRLFPYNYEFINPEFSSFYRIFEYATNNLIAI
jgi:antitoxin component YwqK of YwqJK toxin-antitoxin module